MTRIVDRWHSPHLEREVEIARWGEIGVPVLIFPTAGGDAQEIERFHVVDACETLIADGRIKLYSCDSVNGRALLTNEGDSRHRSWSSPCAAAPASPARADAASSSSSTRTASTSPSPARRAS